MNNLLFTLCEMPALGLILFMTNQCGFPRPVEGVPLAAHANASITVEFVAPASTEYDLELIVEHASGESGEATRIIGQGQQVGCDARLPSASAALRQQEDFATPVEVVVSSKSDVAKTVHFFSPGSCGVSWWSGSSVGRRIARMTLASGTYELTVRSLAPRRFDLVALVSVTPKNTK